MKCDTCKNKLFHSGGSWQAVAEGDDDPYDYEYCMENHWDSGGPRDEEEEKFFKSKPDPWEDCQDYQKRINKNE